MKALAAGSLSLLLSACALPVVSAGTFLPAGDLKKGQSHLSLSMEMGRVLAGPSDADPKNQSPQLSQWEVATWFASDLSFRYGLTDQIQLEVQVKGTSPVKPLAPEAVGGALGGRVRLMGREGEQGLALEVGGRAVGIFVDQQLTRTAGTPTAPQVQTDAWSYRAIGVEAPLIGTWRFNPLFAITASPFLRAYWIRIVHKVISNETSNDTERLDWTPVLSGGLGISAAIDMGPVELAPGVAIELATRPGPGQATQLLLEPGVSVGLRF